MNEPVYVTRPFLPPLDEYTELLQGVWESGILTHNGPLVQRLEAELIDILQVSNMVAVTNGTIALQIAIRALNLRGEIITTPFSWIATCSSIMWEYCEPRFVDIDPESLNMDPGKIEAAINSRTVAIMPVHTFGTPCDVHAIQEIADRQKLKVIYDAAHAIGTTVDGKSVLEYGDVSATSFHATKLFQTGEGGACITTDNTLAENLRQLRFFGHDQKKQIVQTGFNGKMTEIHAAMGLAIIPYFSKILEHRIGNANLYESLLSRCKSIQFQSSKHGHSNKSYFPILLDTEAELEAVMSALAAENIFPRRYFHPSLNLIKQIGGDTCPLSESIASRILCLPHSYNITEELAEKIAGIVVRCLEQNTVTGIPQ